MRSGEKMEERKKEKEEGGKEEREKERGEKEKRIPHAAARHGGAWLNLRFWYRCPRRYLGRYRM